MIFIFGIRKKNIFLLIVEVLAVQKYVNLVDLVKSFYLQKSASIQPGTSLSKFGGDSIHSLIRLPQAAHVAAALDFLLTRGQRRGTAARS